MRRHPFPRLAALAAVAALVLVLPLSATQVAVRAEVPARLSDQEFWKLTTDLSEPGGNFQSDNLLSNESGMQVVIPELTARLGTGGVYLGVGPEQNFTYIAALKPRIAFILDIRRGNRDLHLMYKAFFEMAGDRADFVALLFARKRPDVSRTATAAELFTALESSPSSEEDFRKNLARVRELLIEKHHLAVSQEEIAGIEFVYSYFVRFGPGITYSSNRSGQSGRGTTYASLMQATDGAGVQRSYLSSEETFKVVKDLHARNLIVPVVGNFSGPFALRAIGAWLRERGAVVSAYYLSNVEDYIGRDGSWPVFCQSARTLPLDEKSTFIRSGRGYTGTRDPASMHLQSGVSFINGQPVTTSGGMTFITVLPVTSTSGGSSSPTVTWQTSGGGGGLGTNRLGLMTDDLKPCAGG